MKKANESGDLIEAASTDYYNQGYFDALDSISKIIADEMEDIIKEWK